MKHRDRIDGILGMAWPSVAEEGMSVLFQQMIDQGLVDVPVFGFYLSRYIHVMRCMIVIYTHITVAALISWS